MSTSWQFLVLRAVVGLALVVAPVWTWASTGDTVPHQHWTLAALLIVSLLAGVLLLATTVRAWRRPRETRGMLRAVGAVAGLLVLVALAGASDWLRPFPATDAARAALVSDDAVTVQEENDWYTFTPQDGPATIGLVYSPGTRVDVRATTAVLRPLAEVGYLVVVLEEPLGIALTDLNQSGGAIDTFDSIEHGAVGGHSLGGVAAARFAEQHPELLDGLLLHASYPLDDMSDAALAVTSISGSEDGLSTPAKIAASRADLPLDTEYVEVAGAVHAFFADYGAQPGDGSPTVSRSEAQRQIVAASLELMDRLSGASRPEASER
ncbi:alpha/beta hydrolase [Cellulomonas sp. NPDC089187]|uniref:alpha/beta hydrolase n=1 Tax=Cellulomonas sp. NPDC089187 TaxID=3154970 RepID=UPI0034152C42